MSKTFEEAALELQEAVRELGRTLARELHLDDVVRWLSERLPR